MKRYRDLFESFTSMPNLLSAHRKARKGSGNSPEGHAFFFHLEPELLGLQTRLRDGTYQPAPYRYFRIRDPKARLISVAPFRDRVVHHALINVLEPIWEPRFIFDSYATRKGKGTHAAIKRAQVFTRRFRWYLKTDVDQYFASIDHEVLLRLINRKVADAALLAVIERIVRNGGMAGKGLPIGNLTSQFFANVYLDPLDHYLKDELGIKGYVRYMDDMVLWSNDKENLKSHGKSLEGFLSEALLLVLKPKATFLNQRCHGLPFLGMRVFPKMVRVLPRNLHRLRKKVKAKEMAYEQGEIDESTLTQSIQSHWGHLVHYDTLAWRRNFLGQAIA